LIRFSAQVAAAIPALLFAPVALAHAPMDASGFIEGFAHPFFGVDHVLTMVASGFAAGRLTGGLLRWVPVAALLLGGWGGALVLSHAGYIAGFTLATAVLYALGIGLTSLRRSIAGGAPIA
jgi:urease accessory protein